MSKPSPAHGSPGTLTPRATTARTPWSNPKPRPTSMMAFSPPRSPTRSPPKLMVQSPQSPPKSFEPQVLSPLPSRPSSHAVLDFPSLPAHSSNAAGSSRFSIPARELAHAQDGRVAPKSLPSSGTPVSYPNDVRKSERPLSSTSPVPPPINRAGKPKIPVKPTSAEPTKRPSLAPEPTSEVLDVSPFSTPPGSSEGSPKGDPVAPAIPISSKPKWKNVKESYFPPPPVHHSVAEKLQSTDLRATENQQWKKPAPMPSPSDTPDNRPALPARREKDTLDLRKSVQLQRQAPPDVPVRRSLDQSRPTHLAPALEDETRPPPRRALTSNGMLSGLPPKSLIPPKAPPPRNSGEFKRPVSTPSAQAVQARTYDSDEDDDVAEKQSSTALTDYPDSSQANRRPPTFPDNTTGIATGYETKLFAICGDYVCTTGYVTNVWNVLNGRLIMNLSHGDTVKATALAFRPAKAVEDEGKRLWLGMSTGEMLEIDIPTQSVLYTKSNAHARSAITKIFRYASEMWSVDDDGIIHIWPADHTGSPSLHQTPYTFRIPRGHTFSIISGSQLWLAFTKDIRVYNRTSDNSHFLQMTQSPLSQLNVGDVTSGAIVSSQPDRVYFGHADGKVTVYSKKGFECLGIINVSVYKISSLVGVGDYLWAGYSTGMIYVYDTKSSPWKVLKDWKAHERPIAGILADRTSIWKLDRFQVASLGTDMMLRIWDGMLKSDWLGRFSLSCNVLSLWLTISRIHNAPARRRILRVQRTVSKSDDVERRRNQTRNNSKHGTRSKFLPGTSGASRSTRHSCLWISRAG